MICTNSAAIFLPLSKISNKRSSKLFSCTVINNDDATLMIHGLEFPKDDAELDADPSDSDGYLSEVCLFVLFTSLYQAYK